MASILGLAATAFACDRLFLQSGSAPEATPPPAAGGSAVHEEPKAVAAAATEVGVDPSAPTLAERLKVASANVKKGEDPFAARWRGVTSASSRAGAKPEAAQESTADGFAKTHVLTSVSKFAATISKRPYRVGDDVDGWKLKEVSVDKLWAKLEMGNASVTLRLKTIDPKAITQVSPDGNP